MTIVAVAIVYASITGLTQEIAYKKKQSERLSIHLCIHTSQGGSGRSKINSYSLISAIF
ncbi:hypothetical protein [Holospora undulata]|uniref:hypothetical protein n=1 Tax=Holospora undulata TaxID=1169117 RepID=UPI0003C4F81E|nr:hypothetical protein [Holospora undulata]